ncbi:MAG: hypothetical protein GXO86_01720 [Chlorobi bacterium]|nr:hypothetical protein [Chlorobiota bacterium]
MENNLQHQESNTQRPAMLTVLCILTFIGSGLSAFANLLLFFYYEPIKKIFESGQVDFKEGSLEMESFKLLMGITPDFFLFQGILYLISLFGAIMMWNLNKTGFHLYAVAQILLLIIFEFYITGAPFPLIPLLFSIIFILLYFRNLRFMK